MATNFKNEWFVTHACAAHALESICFSGVERIAAETPRRKILIESNLFYREKATSVTFHVVSDIESSKGCIRVTVTDDRIRRRDFTSKFCFFKEGEVINLNGCSVVIVSVVENFEVVDCAPEGKWISLSYKIYYDLDCGGNSNPRLSYYSPCLGNSMMDMQLAVVALRFNIYKDFSAYLPLTVGHGIKNFDCKSYYLFDSYHISPSDRAFIYECTLLCSKKSSSGFDVCTDLVERIKNLLGEDVQVASGVYSNTQNDCRLFEREVWGRRDLYMWCFTSIYVLGWDKNNKVVKNSKAKGGR